MSEFTFKDIDLEGLETLKAISVANKFNRWMYDEVSTYCQGKVLEIGSGIGNISDLFLQEQGNIWLSDLRDNYLEYLTKNFSNAPGIIKMDIVHPSFDIKYAEHVNTFDSVFALNVIEHIEDDVLALSNIYKLLKQNGTVLILVPAYQWLYNEFDKNLDHYRRYNATRIENVISEAGFNISKSFYFNAVGTLGWFFSGSILKKKNIPVGQMKIYNSLVPIFKLVDKAIFKSYGLSVVCVATKK